MPETKAPDLAARLNRSLAEAGAAIAAEYDAERPRREALQAFERQSRRVVLRENRYGSSPRYGLARVGEIVYQPAHIQEFHYLGDSKVRREQLPAMISIARGSYAVSEAKLGDWARIPSSKALRRIEAAEAALAEAKAELAAATRAAFTYGKPIALSAVKASSKMRQSIAERAK